ncbi:hypothetical protein IMZ31_19835 (plasmid) [Pontibacillus sp. ALD_SL1]|uniref:hypothetical protein n=1 Tax=Pontibacillus sp. ALD_SL1 TaxID=2777185 RepID=UPI001A971265|nr:hypothetical protein [Pontibacillus sp. ALD_SL1]QST02803.1 hypothetical protein IMZ31_19835 [Pontibacillus sp. ALD_SL1]
MKKWLLPITVTGVLFLAGCSEPESAQWVNDDYQSTGSGKTSTDQPVSAEIDHDGAKEEFDTLYNTYTSIEKSRYKRTLTAKVDDMIEDRMSDVERATFIKDINSGLRTWDVMEDQKKGWVEMIHYTQNAYNPQTKNHLFYDKNTGVVLYTYNSDNFRKFKEPYRSFGEFGSKTWVELHPPGNSIPTERILTPFNLEETKATDYTYAPLTYDERANGAHKKAGVTSVPLSLEFLFKTALSQYGHLVFKEASMYFTSDKNGNLLTHTILYDVILTHSKGKASVTIKDTVRFTSIGKDPQFTYHKSHKITSFDELQTYLESLK